MTALLQHQAYGHRHQTPAGCIIPGRAYMWHQEHGSLYLHLQLFMVIDPLSNLRTALQMARSTDKGIQLHVEFIDLDGS